MVKPTNIKHRVENQANIKKHQTNQQTAIENRKSRTKRRQLKNVATTWTYNHGFPIYI